jgi:hypothetical protein
VLSVNDIPLDGLTGYVGTVRGVRFSDHIHSMAAADAFVAGAPQHDGMTLIVMTAL